MKIVPIAYKSNKPTTDAIMSLVISLSFSFLLIKEIGPEIETNPMTYPNVGDMPALNPAQIGRNIPKPRQADVMMSESTAERVTKHIIKTMKNCNDTFTFSPKGMLNIPITHKIDNKIASLQILLVVRFIV